LNLCETHFYLFDAVLLAEGVDVGNLVVADGGEVLVHLVGLEAGRHPRVLLEGAAAVVVVGAVLAVVAAAEQAAGGGVRLLGVRVGAGAGAGGHDHGVGGRLRLADLGVQGG